MTVARIDADLAVQAHPVHGEGPVWDDGDATLVWVDILGGRVHRYRPADGSDHAVDVGQPVGAAVPRRDGGLVLAVERGFALLNDGL
jgi:sugar lactone lactonase YvrE